MPLDNVRISPLDFGFIHSHATYDVMRGLTFFDKHYQRFFKNCKYYGFTPPDKNKLLNIIKTLLDQPNMFVWLIMWKGTPPSGSPRDMSGPDHFLVYTKPYYVISNKPVTLQVIEELPRAKGYQTHKNFAWIELTKAQQLCHTDTAIIRSVDGWINEGPGFGICFVRNGAVWTPATDVLNSITIQVVEEICKDLNIRFNRKNFKSYKGEEAFLCSTSGGITPVKSCNLYKYNLGPNTLTHQIKEKYDNFY